MTDTSSNLARNALSALSSDDQRALNDPAILRAMDKMRDGLVNVISEGKSDGSPEFEQYERECCRTLRTLTHIKNAMAVSPQLNQLKEHNDSLREPKQD